MLALLDALNKLQYIDSYVKIKKYFNSFAQGNPTPVSQQSALHMLLMNVLVLYEV